MTKLLYIEKIPAAERTIFETYLRNICTALNVPDPNYMMQVFYAESKVNPQAVNKTTGAVGLIQFMPSTAKGLGTSTSELLKLTASQQLKWVHKYFLPYKGRLNSYYDVYLAVFFPAAIGKPDTWVMQAKNLSPEIIAKQNPAINIIKDKKITVAEFKDYLVKTVPKAFRNLIFPVAAGTGALLLTAIFFF